jgi:hypothetical protein
MFIPLLNQNMFDVFYMGTDTNSPKPGKQRLELRKNGIKLGVFKLRFISSNQLIKADVSYQVLGQQMSVGGAVAGELLAGGIGAIAGASRGSKKVESCVTIFYKDESGKEQQIALITKAAESIKKKIDKRYK